MNLHACLGVGPGNQLLLGALTPTLCFSAPIMRAGALVEIAARAPLRPAHHGPRDAHARQARVDAIALRLRQRPALSHEAIAREVGCSRSYVSTTASSLGLTRSHRAADHLQRLVVRARGLMDKHGWTQKRAAAEIGISGPYLSILLAKGGA